MQHLLHPMRRSAVRPLALALSLLLVVLTAARTRAEEMFPFVMPGLEPNRGITDMSWLNAAPAGSDGFVHVQDGHFVDGRGRRLRLLATNFTFGSPFPDHDTAQKLAVRLASLGINCIRFHHMDKQCAPQGIWKPGTPKLNVFDPYQLDRLDYFIAQLKQHGIYADLNLHVSRSYWQGEDFDDGLADDAERRAKMPNVCKGIDKINDQMIRMQRDYARALLTHTNTYTRTAYAAEPCVAIVEINNENSLLALNVRVLPDSYRADVLRKWNRWLTARYPSSDRLLAAWGGREDLGTNLLPGACSTQGGEHFTVVFTSPGTCQVTLTNLPAVTSQAQLQWTGLKLEEGRIYTVAFEGRSDEFRTLPLSVRLQQPGGTNCGLSEEAELSSAWNTFNFCFRARSVTSGAQRLDFILGAGPAGTFALRDLTLRAGGSLGLKVGETLEAGTVIQSEPRCNTPRGRDWTRFLAETERAYDAGMRAFLKTNLAVHASIIDTQASYGGIAGVFRESANDFVDMHSYWQHPVFPGKMWDGNNWRFANTPMVDASQGAANLSRLATHRIEGKPYTVSEYDHPAPSHYAAEMFPLASSVAAVQDWDGLFQFDWGGTNTTSGKIEGCFSLQQHPGKLAFLPAAALMFRRGDISPAAGSDVLSVPADQVEDLTAAGTSLPDLWKKAGVNPVECLNRRLGVTFGRGTQATVRCSGPDSSPIRWVPGLYTVDAPAVKVVAGRCTGTNTTLAGVSFDVQANPRNFAVLTLNAVDGRSVGTAKQLLLVAAGNVENTDFGWNADHTSVSNQWGRAPTICEGIAANITLDTTRASARVFSLDGSGTRAVSIPATCTGGKLRFAIGPQFRTLWYEIATE